MMEQDLLESSLKLWRNSEGRKFLVQLTLQIAQGEGEGELYPLHCRCRHFHGNSFLGCHYEKLLQHKNLLFISSPKKLLQLQKLIQFHCNQHWRTTTEIHREGKN
jgi:hypothetical protein